MPTRTTPTPTRNTNNKLSKGKMKRRSLDSKNRGWRKG